MSYYFYCKVYGVMQLNFKLLTFKNVIVYKKLNIMHIFMKIKNVYYILLLKIS